MSEINFELHDGTQDQKVFDEVFTKNQYRLPDSLPQDSIIVDIGANIGAFALACLMRGAGTVVCFEPGERNFQQLTKNMAEWPGQVPCFQAAVWRSDRAEKLKFLSHPQNTAAGAVVPLAIEAPGDFVDSGSVASIGMDEILFHCTDGGKNRVTILKVDAETAEYPILYTAKHLHCVDTIVGETHQCDSVWPGDKYNLAGFPQDQACADGMKAFLESQGFSVTQAPESADNRICTLFFATRKTPETV